MVKITKKLFKNLAGLAKNAVPNEIGGILLGKEIADDFILFPGEFSNHYIKMNLFNIPIYTNALGTFHSHPIGPLKPSQADLNMFSKIGSFHIILNSKDYRCYNNSGKEIKLIMQ